MDVRQQDASPDAEATAENRLEPELNPLLPIVGVGASAGGLGAFAQLLKALPVDTGMAFVLVQHLAPSHESALAGILSRATGMPVTEVSDEPQVEPNHVYVIPPNQSIVIVRGHLRLLPRDERVHHPIDQFFRSLAEHQGHMAIGVVLSGTATDGTQGLEAIKGEGGITFAQDDSAQYRGMPRSAVASGCVDFVLSPEGIAHELARIAAHPFVALRQEAAPAKADLLPILQLLHAVTGVDFAKYKSQTLGRRIKRRMVLLKKDGLGEYEEALRQDPAEVEALYHDILINVTSFFRDPAMFDALQAKVIPALLKDRSRKEPLRAWVLGCSTGEEAYSLAMILAEVIEASPGHANPQLFATDLNVTWVERARAGVYPKERLENVSSERLRQFFVEQDGSFRVSKYIRDMCVFSRHNALSDPPFSRMDLISCRNLLIYLEPSLQRRIIPILHYALKPSGALVLGASETVGQFRDLFRVEDGKHRIFIKEAGASRPPPLLSARVLRQTRNRGRFEELGAGRVAAAFRASDLHKTADRLLLGFAPAAVLLGENLEILEFRGNTEAYLVPAQGKASLSLLKMARPGLLVPLRVLLERAKQENTAVREDGVRLESEDGQPREVALEVVPVAGSLAEERGFLVLFEEAPAKRPPGKPKARSVESAETVARLEQDLASTREYVQTLGDQHDAATEELLIANEEAQSANEELQSINEELETAKEELQSSNEELTTVNDELNSRNHELGQLNSDLGNLIRSVQVAIVIVDRDLRIRRFSSMAEELLSIIPADVGRPITDIRMKLDLPELDSLLTEVIERSTPLEREVQAKDGRWYALRVRPYLTPDQRVDGAVLMMTDVDTIRRAREYAENIVATVRDPLLVLDAELRVRSASRSFYDSFQVAPEETDGRLVYELGNGQWDIPDLRRLLRTVLSGVPVLEDFVVEHDFERLGRRVMRLNARKLVAPGERESILISIEDVSEISRLETSVRESAERFKLLFDRSPLPKWTFEIDSLRFVDVNHAAIALYGYTREEFLGMRAFDLCTPESRAALQAELARSPQGWPRLEVCQHRKKNGEIIDVEARINEVELAGKRVLLVSIIDVTERNRFERELRERAEELDAANRGKTDFIAVLSHELRTPLNAISGWAEVLKNPALSDDDRRKGIEIISRNSRIQAQLISDLLDVHRITTGKLSLELRRVDLRDEIRAAIDAALPASEPKRIRIKSETDPAPASVLGDSARLQQVLGNLLSNAIKFTAEGGEIRVALRRASTSVEVKVSDSGQGISPDVLPYIFDRFRQSESLLSRSTGGLGLGLAVSRQLVELHGGTISAHSPGKGRGATFTVSLPVTSEARPAITPTEPRVSSPVSLAGLMVLVVDDELEAREPVRRLLEEHGAEVISVRSADEALDAIQRQRPDLLVSDIGMPGRDGYELIRAVRALPERRGGRIPAIALTAFGTTADRERALRAGYVTHLAKPVEAAELIAAVAALATRLPEPPPTA